MVSTASRRTAMVLVIASAAACNAILGIDEGNGLLDGAGGSSGTEGGAGGQGGGAGGPGGAGGEGPCPVSGDGYLPSYAWSARVGSEAETDVFRDAAVAVGDGGRIYSVATFNGPLDDAVPVSIDTGDGFADFVIVERDADGAPITIWRFGGVGVAAATDLAVDPTGDGFVVAGRFTGTLSFGDGEDFVSAGSETDPGVSDLFIARIASDGSVAWTKQIGDDEDQDTARVAFDPSGDLVVVLLGGGLVDWGGEQRDAFDNLAVFLAKLDAQGQPLWTRPPIVTNQDDLEAVDVAVGPDGSIFVVGGASAGAQFGGNLPDEAFFDVDDAYVVKYDSAGSWVGHRIFGDTGYQWIRTAAVGPSGDLFVGGQFEMGLQQRVTGGGSEPLLDNAERLTGYATWDAFVARVRNEDLEIAWTAQVSGAGEQSLTGIAVDCAEHVTAVGVAVDPPGGGPGVDFGDGIPVPGDADDVANGYSDMLRVTYDTRGVRVASDRLVDGLIEVPYSVAVDGSGSAIITGYFYDSILFSDAPNGPLNAVPDTWDQFVVRYLAAPER